MFIDCGLNVVLMLLRKNYSESEEKIMCPKKEGRKEKASDKIALFVIKVVE